MRSKYAWLLLPPILALIVFLGPLQNLNDGTGSVTGTPAGTTTGTANGTPRRASVGSQVPKLPGFWQITSTLAGVLLLGVVFLGLMRKLRENSQATPSSPLVLRQSLRLSARHHVHAVQYEDRILVLGACDNNISVLCTGEDPSVADDEAAVRDRDRDQEDQGEGAVPRDMVLPRPDKQQRRLPRKPAAKTGLVEETARKLASFRTLLQREQTKA